MEVKIRSAEELQIDVFTLQAKEELMCRNRTTITQNINATRKQITILEEMIINNTQYEIFND